jgi:two-component system, NarL family, nitrate/nitrite response regulator NarL
MRSPERRTLPQRSDIEQTTQRTCRGPASAVGDPPPGRAWIVLIDDDWDALSRLREIVEQDSDLVVVATCRCAAGAILAVQHYRPALLILDVRLPDRDGIELIRDITAISDVKVIVFTVALRREEIVRILRSGAAAIVSKDQPTSMLVSCVRKILAGKPWTPQALTGADCGAVKSLSPREQEVAQCAAAGARNKEIAWRLGISEGTVKLHLFHAYRKLGVGNRVGLALALRRAIFDILIGITLVDLTFVS